MFARPRGVAIPTALFIVLLLFGLITAIQLLTTQNLRITRYGHAKLRAQTKATSAGQKLLYCLNHPSSAQATNDVRVKGSTQPITDLLGALKAGGTDPSKHVLVTLDPTSTFSSDGEPPEGWIQNSSDPTTHNVEILFTQAMDTQQTQSSLLSIVESPPVDGVLYARIGEGDPTRSSTYFYRKSSTQTWVACPPVPTEIYRRFYPGAPNPGIVKLKAGPSPHPVGPEADPQASPDHYRCSTRFARNVYYPTADDQGHLYATLHRGGPYQIDTIMQLDVTSATPSWSLLPCLPQQAYRLKPGSAGKQAELFYPTDSPRAKEMCSNGKGILYVRWPRVGPDTIATIDLSASPAASPSPGASPPSGWSILPPVPKYVYRGDGVPVPSDGFVGALTDLSCDGRGNLYARWPRDAIDTLYRYDRANNVWGALPPPPREVYRYVAAVKGGKNPHPEYYELVPIEKVADPGQALVAFNLRYLAADRSSNSLGPSTRLFAVFTREGINTIYQLDVPNLPAPGPAASPGGIITLPSPVGRPSPNAVAPPTPYKWQVLPPAPAIFYKKPTSTDPSGDDAKAAVSDSKACLDGAGVLYIRWVRGGIDSLFGYDVNKKTTISIYPVPDDLTIKSGSFQLLNLPDAKSYLKQDPSTPQSLLPVPGDPGLPFNIIDLCGGGVPAASGTTTVQVVAKGSEF